jgi:CheY-like chemotaxis protein
VIGASDMLILKGLDADTDGLVRIIKSSGEILLNVINSVLDLTRLDEGKLDLVNERVNLRIVFESCIDPLQVLSQAKGLEHKVYTDDCVSKYYSVDPSLIRQLILNLGGNAIKLINAGFVEIPVTEVDSVVKLSVKDSGIGIAEEKLQQIFDPFSQVDSSVVRQFEGSGLGLSIVDRLVKIMGGEICVESELGEGTCFILSLPLKVSPEQVNTGPAKEVLPIIGLDISPTTVLVADDNAINRKVASQLLLKLGHAVVEAVDGLEAISAVEKGNIDLVLMDVQMPNMDGLTATGEIRKLRSPLCNIPIIGVTANGFPSAESEILESGMNDYLSKPVRLDQLRYALFKSMLISVV